MYTRFLTTLLLISAATIQATGCSQSKPPKPVKPLEYVQPAASPLAQEDVARKLQTYFPVEAVARYVDHGGYTQNLHENTSPRIWRTEVRQEFAVPDKFLIGERGMEKCEDAVQRYLADLSEKCSELGGVFGVGQSERKEDGFTVSSTYTLPQRTGKVRVTLQTHEHKSPDVKQIVILISEDAEGQEKER